MRKSIFLFIIILQTSCANKTIGFMLSNKHDGSGNIEHGSITKLLLLHKNNTFEIVTYYNSSSKRIQNSSGLYEIIGDTLKIYESNKIDHYCIEDVEHQKAINPYGKIIDPEQDTSYLRKMGLVMFEVEKQKLKYYTKTNNWK